MNSLAGKITQRLICRNMYAMSTNPGYMNYQGMTEAEREYEQNPPAKFHNKKYYNPAYHSEF